LYVLQKHLKKQLNDTVINSYDYVIEYGNLFNTKNKVLAINKNHSKTYYFLESEKPFDYIDYELGSSFVSDTIYDINNDSELDLIVTTKNGGNIITEVRLQNNGKLQDEIKLYNAVFDTDKTVFRGYTRHNTPIIQFYKFEWNKTNIDSIEWLAYNSGKEPIKFVKANSKDIYEVNDSGEYYLNLKINEYQLLKELPKEYVELERLYKNK